MIRETIAIRWPSGKRANIAKADFDPAKHVLWDAPIPARIDMGEQVSEQVAPEPPKKRGRPRRG